MTNPELSVRFTVDDEKDEATSIFVSLVRLDTGASSPPVAFTPPLGDKVLARLHWYLEIYTGWPTETDFEIAAEIEARLEPWGRELLASLTADPAALRIWQQFLDAPAAGGKLLTIDATDPRVLRLPWELLADEGGHLFSEGISIRRRLQQVRERPLRPLALPVRILAVVSRPDDAGFIDPRAVSGPLLDAVAELGQRVTVEFLYPPTLTALSDRLRDRHAPPVHVVHFDGHGVYDARQGLGYLLFESLTHGSDRVDADQLGTLLNNSGVPLMVLNACQSAKQDTANPYASVAARLIRAGVGSVLAMNYSVLVVAARLFVGSFYAALADGLSVGQAVDAARHTLLANEQRYTFTRNDREQTLRLRDWFLPALYQRQEDPIIFPRESAAPLGSGVRGEGNHRLPRALIDPTAPGGLPPEPAHRFHGRARDLLRLERTLAERPLVVLHGFGGLGKTTLAAEAGRWFYRTGRFPGGAAFVSFEAGGSLSQLCSWVGQALSGDPNFTLGEGDPVQRIAALLAARPGLIILDNFESVLGREPLLPPAELRDILTAVHTWATAGSGRATGPAVLITTRDTTFNDARFAPSRGCAHLPLAGLSEPDALELAAAVLADYGIDRARIDRAGLTELMARLGGHPLSLLLVLPHLARHTPAQLSDRFEALLPGFKQGQAEARNDSLAVSLEFSLRRLGPDSAARLPDLAVFVGGALEMHLLMITEMAEADWLPLRGELEQAALLRLEPIPNIASPFLRFHPTLLPYLAAKLDPARRAELEPRYRQVYYQAANELYHLDDKHPHEARAIVLAELPNLHRALALTLAAAEAALASPPAATAGRNEGGPAALSHAAITFAECLNRFLNVFGRWRERDLILRRLEHLAPANDDGPLTQADVLRLLQQGETMWQQGQAAAAEQLFRALLARFDTVPAYDNPIEQDYDRATTLWLLGRCLEAQGQPTAALAEHRRALALFERLSVSDDSAKRMVAVVSPDLANNLAATGEFDEAEQVYKNGLKIAHEIDDHRTVGVIQGQLGTLAMRRGDLAAAAQRYGDALATFRAIGEPQMEAVAWHQLGRVHEEAKVWPRAEECYREAVRIREHIRDWPELAKSYNQLALVAQGAGRLAEAERWYLRAQEIKDKVAPRDVTTLGNLANLYLTQNRLAEAEVYARRAVAIVATLDLSAEPWKSYSILADILQAAGHPAEARQWRRKEQDAFARWPAAGYQLPPWAGPVVQAVIAAAPGQPQAQAAVAGFLPQLAQTNDWRNFAAAIERLLAGEREYDALCLDLDRIDAYMIRAVLQGLAG